MDSDGVDLDGEGVKVEVQDGPAWAVELEGANDDGAYVN